MAKKKATKKKVKPTVRRKKAVPVVAVPLNDEQEFVGLIQTFTPKGRPGLRTVVRNVQQPERWLEFLGFVKRCRSGSYMSVIRAEHYSVGALDLDY